MKASIVAALVATIAAPGAQAASFTFTETFGSGRDMANGGTSIPVTATGSFDGDVSGNVIANLRNISVFLNGTAFVGNGALYAGSYDFDRQTWRIGGATISLDGTANNFVFTDEEFPGDTEASNFYQHTTGGGQSAAADNVTPSGLGGLYAFTMFGPTNPLVVTQVAAGVPEPATWALMILGFGMVGATVRRRAASIRFA